MFGIGGTELVVLIVVIAILIGPEQIPSVVRHVRQLMREVSKARSDFQDSVAQDETLRSIKETVDEVKSGVKSQIDSVTAGIQEDIKKIEEEIKKKDEQGHD
jgi:sec-independent protein translocase protein TatB